MTLTIDQADRIRQLWYTMDGPSDRPRQVSEWAEVVEGLLRIVGQITGIDSAAAISPMEPAAPAAADTVAEYAALTSEQQDRVLAGGKIAGIPMHCEYCPQMAVYSSADGDGRAAVACYNLEHIAAAMSVGSGVDPDFLLDHLVCHNRRAFTGEPCHCP